MGVTGGCLGFAAVRTRRLELAGALHVGVGPIALLGTQLTQTLAWLVAAGGLLAPVMLVAVGEVAAAERPGLLELATPPVAGALVAVMLGVAAGVLVTRERHLFDYFKSR